MIYEEAVAENAWRLADGLYRILLPMLWSVPFVSVYLVESRGERMLVDAGVDTETSLRALGRALKAIGVQSGGIDTLLLTHGHPDHAGGAASVQRRWGGRMLLHPADMHRRGAEGADVRQWAAAQGVPQDAVEAFAKFRPNGGVDLGDDVTALDPRAPIRLGELSFDVVEVPGHCPGQVMLHEAGRGWLFSADQVVEPEAANVWLVPGLTGDPLGAYLASLRRTAAIEAGLVLPSHGLPLRGGLAEHVGRQLRFQEEYVERVRGLVPEAGASTWQVAAGLEPAMRDPSVLLEVLAALSHLQATHRLRRDGQGVWRHTER